MTEEAKMLLRLILMQTARSLLTIIKEFLEEQQHKLI